MSEIQQVAKAPDVMLQELDGEAVLLNLANGQYYGLDEDSFRIYKCLISSGSLQEAYGTLLEEYEVDAGRLQSDLDKFLMHLLENGLVVYVDHKPG
jgi:hypothetical protein